MFVIICLFIVFGGAQFKLLLMLIQQKKPKHSVATEAAATYIK